MSFDFSADKVPGSLLGARLLLWLQSILIIMFGLSLLIAGVFWGASTTVAMGPVEASGTKATVLGIVIAALGAGFILMGTKVTQPTAGLRNGIVGAEVVFAALFIATAGMPSLVINLALVAGVIVLLFMPESQAAIANHSGTPVASTPVAAAEDSPVDAEATDAAPPDAAAPPGDSPADDDTE